MSLRPIENFLFKDDATQMTSLLIFSTLLRCLCCSLPTISGYLHVTWNPIKSLESRYVNMVTKDVKSRLLYCFKGWAKKEGKRLGDKIVVTNSFTHNDLANLISTSRQTVTVILNELKESGAITYNRREIEFTQLMLAS